jgi:ABC-type sugar transport system substrate-binding protein
MMNMKLSTLLIALLLCALAVPLAVAGDKDKDKDSDHARTLTGCLQKGDGANEYALTAKDGSTWELRSDSVDLAPHVGHTVTLTGTASGAHAKAHEMKEGAKEEMKEHGMDKDATEHGHLKVTNLAMISDSCRP